MRRPLLVIAALVPILLGLVGNLATNLVSIPGAWQPWVWILLLLLSGALVVIEVRRGKAGGGAWPFRVSINSDQAANDLARAVEAQWRREQEYWRVQDPFPLPVSWRNASNKIVDHWSNIQCSQPGVEVRPLSLQGRLDQIVDVYRRVPSERLVVLGKAGAGKTNLAVRLVLDLLAARAPGDPIPVIFSLGSWDPTVTSLRTWMADQLISSHPFMAAVGPDGRSVAAALIEADGILPVLDGFDEIASGLYTTAMDALNRTSLSLVLTSRNEEYRSAVRRRGVLAAAAVVVLDDLGPADIADYLPRTVRSVTDTEKTTIWDPILKLLAEEPGNAAVSRLYQVLSTPLMVSLARSIYSDDSRRDPSELLDSERFPTSDSLANHLLAEFIPSAYRQIPSDRQIELTPWPVENVERWLGWLASHLERRGTRDLAWWQLNEAIPRPLLPLMSAFFVWFAIVFFTSPAFALGVWFDGGYRIDDGIVLSSLAGMILSVITATAQAFFVAIFSFATNRFQTPPSRLIMRGRARYLPFGIAVGLLAGLLVSLFASPAVSIAAGVWNGVVAWFTVPIEASTAVGPLELLRANRKASVLKVVAGGVMMGVGPALIGIPTLAPAIGLAAAIGFWLSTSAWSDWIVVSRVWLPLWRRLPWRVVRFLDDAHRRGVLRQAGPIYQFRHVRLQKQLALNYSGGSVRQWQEPAGGAAQLRQRHPPHLIELMPNLIISVGFTVFLGGVIGAGDFLAPIGIILFTWGVTHKMIYKSHSQRRQ